MKLPNRLYYSLDKAAKELNCDVSDLIHYAANGYINLCVKIITEDYSFMDEALPNWAVELIIDVKSLSEKVMTYISPEHMKFTPTKEGDFLASEYFYLDFYNQYLKLKCKVNCLFEKESNDIWEYDTNPISIRGLLQIPFRFIYNSEFSLLSGESISVRKFDIPFSNIDTPVFGRFGHCDSWHSSAFEERFVIEDSPREGVIVRDMTNKIVSENAIDININDLLITADELDRIKNFDENNDKVNCVAKEMPINDGFDNPKTLATYSELITSVISMIPEMKGVDINVTPTNRLKEMLSATAAKNGLELPDIHPQTLAKYLGRERTKRTER